MIKSPSKYTSLKLLEAIKNDYYRGVNGQEYCAEEVDALIMQKQSEKDERNVLKLQKLADHDKIYIGIIK